MKNSLGDAMLNGIIVIDKEPGFTSHDVVAKMRGICGQKKIGHTGTLDPAAVGVLPVCLGSATKLCGLLTEKDKEYEAELLLGVETDTQDTTGRILDRKPVTVTSEQIGKCAAAFVGEIMQIPPMYSALKVNGKKLYELARVGVEVERQARPVTIHELEILEVCLPVVKLRVVCSRGTYIRTLCADMGKKLGCGGTMRFLRRTRVGGFSLEKAMTLGALEKLRDEGRLQDALLPVDSVFPDCPALHVRDGDAGFLENGNALLAEQFRERAACEPEKWVRVYRPAGSFAGIYAYSAEKGRYMPVKMFLGKE